MNNFQEGTSNSRSRRLPPLSGRQRAAGTSKGQIMQRSCPSGHLFKGNTNSVRVKSARSNMTESNHEMIITGQTFVNGQGLNGMNLTGRSGDGSSRTTSRIDDRSRSPLYFDVDQELVTTYLNSNRSYLDRYIMHHISEEVVEKWLMEKRSVSRRTMTRETTKDEDGTFNDDVNSTDKEKSSYKKFVQDLTKNITQMTSIGQLLHHLAACVATATKSDDYGVYLLDDLTQELVPYKETNNRFKPNSKSVEITVNGRNKSNQMNHESIDIGQDPNQVFHSLIDKPCNILSHPVCDLNDRVIGVIHLYRVTGRKSFSEEERRICSNILAMGGLLLKCQEFYLDMDKQRNLNDFLLTVTKSIFQDIVSMDTVVIKIMTYAQRRLEADRASLFLLDQRNRELFARIFDVGITKEVDKLVAEPVDIRFSTKKGVAGFVAATGQTLNITDAYSDDRFNREIDLITGYKTKSILCMPICIRGKIIGVVQMINKRNGTFTKTDEDAFQMFAIYCGLALHHAKLYEKIRRSEQRNKVALEVLSYHSQSTEEEVQQLMALTIPKELPELTTFEFSPWSISNDDKPLYVLYMFRDLFQQARFDMSRLSRFTLTIRKNYRNVPYHNWSHAFSVAQSMYTILKNMTVDLNHLECLSLFVSCLCHDVDHRGFTNQFMVNSSSPLASLYSTSTMEHHHFNHTITILQQEGHNIFTSLTSEDYKQVLSDIKHFILATDLAVFFSNKGRLKEILGQESFSWSSKEHRQLGFSMSMTACDLCASSKPWDIQMGVVRVIFEEFYAQGDKEKANGKTTMAMMDRDKSDQLPISQAGFLEGICIPCYELLADIIPQTQPMLEGIKANLRKWQDISKVQKDEENKIVEQRKSETVST